MQASVACRRQVLSHLRHALDKIFAEQAGERRKGNASDGALQL
jgi:hypothetical protein